MIGFRPPAPASAAGTLQFTVHETVEEPVAVPAGTQVFTPDGQGDNIVYETERAIEATPARLLDIYYADGVADWLEKTDLTRPQRFFTPCGDNLQRHRFWLSQPDMLRLDCPCTVELELRQSARYLEEESAKKLAALQWSYMHAGESLPFDTVRAENGRLVLEKHSSLSIDADEAGRRCICCTGRPDAALTIEGALLRSAPLARCRADTLFCGDLPIALPEGGYCFGQRPMPYALFYIRSDTVLTKRGATANLRLDIAPIAEEPPEQPPHYNFTQAIIDKRGAVERKPDNAYISAVVWEYYNGGGWRRLETEGSIFLQAGRRTRDPLHCAGRHRAVRGQRRDGPVYPRPRGRGGKPLFRLCTLDRAVRAWSRTVLGVRRARTRRTVRCGEQRPPHGSRGRGPHHRPAPARARADGVGAARHVPAV